MHIQIIRNDIANMRVDTIDTTGNKYLRDGSGVNGVIHKAADPLLESMPNNSLMVYLVVFTMEIFHTGNKLFAEVKQYINDCYAEEHWDARRESVRARRAAEADASCANKWHPLPLEDAHNQKKTTALALA